MLNKIWQIGRTLQVFRILLGVSIFFGQWPGALLAADQAKPSLQLETNAHEKVFSIDKSGNLLVKGKIVQNATSINITSPTNNWSLNTNSAHKFLVQIDEKSNGNAVGNFYLTGALNSLTTNPLAKDYISYLTNPTGSLNAIFKKTGDLLISGRVYENVSNIETFVPDAGAVQFQFSKYEVENTTNALAIVNVVRTGEKKEAISIQYHFLDGTARAGVHYQSITGTLNFAANASVSSFTVPILYNAISTTSKSLTLELFNPGGGCRLGLISRVPMVINVLPPDPEVVSPIIAQNNRLEFCDLTRFIYQSPAYAPLIQMGMTSGTIQAAKAGAIRGRVYQASVDTSTPLAGVRISILNHPEYGSTLSRVDGHYDMVVNGGDPLTIMFEKAGYLRSQRKILPKVQDFTWASVVALIKPKTDYYFADLLNNSQYNTIHLNPVTDQDGTRRGILLFPPKTNAKMIFAPNADGTTSPSVAINAFNFYVNEFTVGKLGPAAMPADLDPQVEYTYCAEFSVLEAEAAGAKMVRFDTPVIYYMNNFIGFPVGSNIPSGSYFRDTLAVPDGSTEARPGGRWIPERNGRVIKILRVDPTPTRPIAVIDAMGDDQPTPPDVLAGFGIPQDELYELAANYHAGDTLWRVPVEHFTYPHDLNWMEVLINGICDGFKVFSDSLGGFLFSVWDTISGFGSINVLEQTLHESISISGTPYSLNYVSERTSDYQLGNGRSIIVQLLPDQLTEEPTSITCQLHYGGRVFQTAFVQPLAQTPGLKVRLSADSLAAAEAAGSNPFTIVGTVDITDTSSYSGEAAVATDVYGYPITDTRRAILKIGYSFPSVYGLSQSSFDTFVSRYDNIFSLFPDAFSSSSKAEASSGRLYVTDETPLGLVYRDPNITNGYFILARNQTRTYWYEHEIEIPPPGAGATIYYSPYAKAKSVGNWSLNVHHTYDKEKKMVYQGDGERYQVDNEFLAIHNLGDPRNEAIHRSFAQNRGSYFSGIDAAPDGTVYAADGLRVYKIQTLADERTSVTVFAGSGMEDGVWGDGGNPLNAALNGAIDVAVPSNELVYVAQSGLIRKIEKGKITIAAFNPGARRTSTPEIAVNATA